MFTLIPEDTYSREIINELINWKNAEFAKGNIERSKIILNVIIRLLVRKGRYSIEY